MKYWRWMLAFGLAVAAGAGGAQAEIEKTGTLDCGANKICFHWWPKVTPPAGWRQDLPTSNHANINFMVPEAARTSAVFIYATAIDARGQADTLAGFIADDRKTFLTHNPGLSITDLPDATTADGQVLKVLRFDPKGGSGRWEITAYGEESDEQGNHYYLTFVLSAVSEKLRDDNLDVYKAVLAGYRT
ncbi:hypothetical protein [Asticcacaulis solisilvae]|uniref:hypothetical protein n=1 Tax=Asticcacaulis solisilvae TaxID=1217274 RepID=UPI003FD85AA9